MHANNMEITTNIDINDDTADRDDAMAKLYDASTEGAITSLNLLLEKDKLILSKISLTTFSETPLHISALLGHTRFSQTLLDHHPTLAFCLDSRGRSPLHLASANGHVGTVRALLRTRQQFIDNNQQHEDMCLVKDGVGRTALHYAAMRGHVVVTELLVGAQPRAVFEAGETVLHSCVRYCQLETLKVLVRSVSASASAANVSELINSKEPVNGNTVLHLAVMLNQIQTVKYLLSVPWLERDIKNKRGLKASELVDDHPQIDYNSHRLKQLVTTTNSDDDISNARGGGGDPESWWQKICDLMERVQSGSINWMNSNEMLEWIQVVATLIAQTTFQTTLGPPGGFWTVSSMENDNSCTEDRCLAGMSVLAVTKAEEYHAFLKYSTTSFLASVIILVLVVSGVPPSNKVFAWLRTVALLIALAFMALAYLYGLKLTANEYIMYTVSIWICVSFLALFSVFHTLFVILSLLKKSRCQCFGPLLKFKK